MMHHESAWCTLPWETAAVATMTATYREKVNIVMVQGVDRFTRACHSNRMKTNDQPKWGLLLYAAKYPHHVPRWIYVTMLLSVCIICPVCYFALGVVDSNSTSTHLVIGRSVAQKIYDWETFSEVLNLPCGFDLERNNLLFSQDIPNCYNTLSN